MFGMEGNLDMIKKKVNNKAKKVSKRNPYLQSQAKDILTEIDPKSKIDFEFIGEGYFGETYYFEISSNKLLYNVLLKPGKYILKVFKTSKDKGIHPPSEKEIKYLTTLSKYGLIPEISIINRRFEIMKYIDGDTLWNHVDNKGHLDGNYLVKLDKLVRKWHSLGFAHGDLGDDNILISKNNKLYLIDPLFDNKDEFVFDLDRLRYYWDKYS